MDECCRFPAHMYEYVFCTGCTRSGTSLTSVSWCVEETAPWDGCWGFWSPSDIRLPVLSQRSASYRWAQVRGGGKKVDHLILVYCRFYYLQPLWFVFRERSGSGVAMGGGIQQRGPLQHPGVCGRGRASANGPLDNSSGRTGNGRGRQRERLPRAAQGTQSIPETSNYNKYDFCINAPIVHFYFIIKKK